MARKGLCNWLHMRYKTRITSSLCSFQLPFNADCSSVWTGPEHIHLYIRKQMSICNLSSNILIRNKKKIIQDQLTFIQIPNCSCRVLLYLYVWLCLQSSVSQPIARKLVTMTSSSGLVTNGRACIFFPFMGADQHGNPPHMAKMWQSKPCFYGDCWHPLRATRAHTAIEAID